MARTGIGRLGLSAIGSDAMGCVIADLAGADEIIRIQGVLNATANAVLTWMEEDGLELVDAVDRAIREGCAGADPCRDLDGRDAAAKLAVLSRIAWGIDRAEDDVQRLGLHGLTAADVAAERDRGGRYRLVAQATRDCASVELRRVGPRHPLHGVTGADHAVTLHTRRAGLLSVTGPLDLAASMARQGSLDAHMTRDGASV